MHTFKYILNRPVHVVNNYTTMFELSKIALSFLIFNINVNGPDFFKLKELSFIFFVLISLPYGNFYKLGNFFVGVSVFLITGVLNCIIPGSDETPIAVLSNVLGFFYLYMFAYDKDEYRETIRKTFLQSTTIVSIMIVSIWSICQINVTIKYALTTFFTENTGDKTAFIFMIRNRKILKWWVLGVYFGTAPALIPSLGYMLFKNLKAKKQSNKFLISLHIAALVMTGARANILAAGLLYFIYLCFKLYYKKEIFLATTLILIVGALGMLVVMFFLSDKNESSLAVKNLHKISYFREFDEHQLRYLLIGTGGGSSFYTEGYKKFATLTELTLYETIRRYGVIGSIVLFFVLWFNPIILELSNSKSLSSIYFCIVMSAYIFVACTNPFLFGSIGFCTLLFFRNVSNPYVLERRQQK